MYKIVNYFSDCNADADDVMFCRVSKTWILRLLCRKPWLQLVSNCRW